MKLPNRTLPLKGDRKNKRGGTPWWRLPRLSVWLSRWTIVLRELKPFLLPEALSGFVAVSVCVGVLIEQVRLFTFWAAIFLPLARAAFRWAVCMIIYVRVYR